MDTQTGAALAIVGPFGSAEIVSRSQVGDLLVKVGDDYAIINGSIGREDIDLDDADPWLDSLPGEWDTDPAEWDDLDNGFTFMPLRRAA